MRLDISPLLFSPETVPERMTLWASTRSRLGPSA